MWGKTLGGMKSAELTPNSVLYALHARHALREQKPSSDAHGVRAKAQRLYHVRPPRDTAVHVDLERPTRFLTGRGRSGQARWIVQ